MRSKTILPDKEKPVSDMAAVMSAMILCLRSILLMKVMFEGDAMRFQHTNRPGFLLGFIDFFTAGLFFLFYMPFGGLQNELEDILGHKLQPYWKAYLLGIPTLFIYTLVWMARISEELKAKAIELELEGPYTSWWHMFGWNTFGILLMGPAVATHRFFGTLNRVERELNQRNEKQ